MNSPQDRPQKAEASKNLSTSDRLTLPPSIVKREGQISKREIEQLGSIPLVNLGNPDHGYPEIRPIVFNLSISIGAARASAVTSLGRPNGLWRGETLMGVWILDDSSGVTFVIFSDGLNRNPWKGTTYEAVVPKDIPSAQLVEAVRRLFAYIPPDPRRAR